MMLVIFRGHGLFFVNDFLAIRFDNGFLGDRLGCLQYGFDINLDHKTFLILSTTKTMSGIIISVYIVTDLLFEEMEYHQTKLIMSTSYFQALRQITCDLAPLPPTFIKINHKC